MPMPDKPLTPKQQRFCDYYCGNTDSESVGNITRSAERAGYKNPNIVGTKLMKTKVIKQYIEWQREEQARRSAEAGFELKSELMKIALDLTQKTSDRLRAYELIGKMDGAFVTKVEQTVTDERPLAKYSTEELENMLDNVISFN